MPMATPIGINTRVKIDAKEPAPPPKVHAYDVMSKAI